MKKNLLFILALALPLLAFAGKKVTFKCQTWLFQQFQTMLSL